MYRLKSLNRLVYPLLTVFFCTLFIRLGYWQLQRETEKKQLYTHYLNNIQNEKSLQSVPDDKKALFLGRSIELIGAFLPYYVLLDNQLFQKKIGYRVYSQFRLANTNETVWVELGWVKAPLLRSISPSLPDINTTPSHIKGQLVFPPASGLRLQKVNQIETIHPHLFRIQTLEYQQFDKKGLVTHTPYVVILQDKQGFISLPYLSHFPHSIKKHRMYAWQWFSFAFTLVIIHGVIIVTHRRKKRLSTKLFIDKK